MNHLQDKVAVITGGNSGIGLSAAKAFIDEGVKIVILGRSQKTLNAATETLGEKVIVIRGDVSSDTGFKNPYTVQQS